MLPWNLWRGDPQEQGLGRGPHPGARGHVSPGSGSGRGVTPQTVDMEPQVQGLGVVTLEMWTSEP